MPKKIVLLDDDGVPARLLYEALVTERYDVYLVEQHMPLFDTLFQVKPSLLFMHWSKIALVEAEILALAASDALLDCCLFLLGPALDEDEWDEDEWDYRVQRLWKAELAPFFVEGPLEIQDFINLVNVYMDRPERSAAIPTGGLARTYSYPGGGLPTRPHIHWSLPFHEQVPICHPLLVANHRAYLLDSESCLCALEAESGKLLWSFSPGGEGNANEGERITAFCLQGQSALANKLVYVASTHHMLYELDPSTGQVTQSWRTEDRVLVLEMLPYGLFELLLVGDTYSHLFDPDTTLGIGIPIDLGLKDEEAVGKHLTLYHHPASQVLTMYGWEMINNHGETDFRAVDMDGLGIRRECYFLSYIGPYREYTPEKEGQIARINPCNMPILDETLYLSGDYVHFLEQGGAKKRHEEMEEEEEYEHDFCDALFALDGLDQLSRRG